MIEPRTPSIPAILALALALAYGALLGCGQPAAPERVFLITIDTLRADHLGLYGYPRGVSPFLDSLGAEGLVFDKAYSSCSHTAPSHASLFTGLQPAQHRVLQNGEGLADSLLTLAELFQKQGYTTAGFTTVAFLKELQAGFDNFHNRTRYFPAEAILGEAMDWIRSRPRDDKLFVWIHLFDVHQWIRRAHLDESALEELQGRSDLAGQELLAYLEREHGTGLARGAEKIIDAVDRYDGQLLSTDRQLRRFFETLETEKLSDDALWIVTSDHGEGLGNHDYMGHGISIYEEQIRVPLIFHFADQRFPPGRIKSLARLVDIAPTLARLVGTSFADQVIPPVGQSLMPLLKDPNSAWSVRTAFSQRRPADEMRLTQGWAPGDVFALSAERYKVIGHSEGDHEIFDLRQDPFELDNLAADPPEEAARMLEALLRGFRAMNAQGQQMGEGTINPEYIEELKSLGYL